MTNAVYAMMTAWGLRAAAVMSKQQTIALLAVNGAATLACLACLWRDACAPRLPPAAVALDRAATAHGAALVVDWVTVSRQARAAAIKCLAWRPRAVAPIHVVEERLADARGAWVEAKRRDCLFEATLRESMDALLRAHQTCSQHCLSLGGRGGDDARWFAERADPFARATETLKTQADDKVLMRPFKRTLLKKLLALRLFQQASDKHAKIPKRAADMEATFRPPLPATVAPRPPPGPPPGSAPTTPRPPPQQLLDILTGDQGDDRPPTDSPAREAQITPTLSSPQRPAFGHLDEDSLADIPEHATDDDGSELSLLSGAQRGAGHGLL